MPADLPSRRAAAMAAPALAAAIIGSLATVAASQPPTAKLEPDATFARLLAQGADAEQRRNFDAAIRNYRLATRRGAESGRREDEAWGLAVTCRAEWFADRPERARGLCEQAVVQAQAASFPKAEAEAVKILAVIDSERSDHVNGDRRFARAVALAEQAAEKEILISTLNNWSSFSRERGQIQEAVERSGRALAVADGFPETSARMKFAVPFNLAKALEAAGDEESARHWLDVAARSAEATQFGGGLQHVLKESAQLLLGAGDLDGAGAYYDRAIQLNQSTPGLEVDVALARRGLSATLEARGRVEDALRGYQDALAVLEPRRSVIEIAQILIDIGRCLRIVGRFAEAASVLDRARETADRAALLISGEIARLELAHLQESRAIAGAMAAYLHSAERFRNLGLPSHAARAYAAASRFAERRGDLEAAEKWISAAMAETEQVQANLPADLRWRFLETSHEVYAAAYRLKMRRFASTRSDDDAQAALAIIERERSSDMAEARQRRQSPALTAGDADSPERRIARIQLELLGELKAARRKELLSQRADAERDLMLRSGGAVRGRWAGARRSVAETRSTLGSDEALLTYTLDEPASVFVLTRSTVRVAPLLDASSVRNQVAVFGALEAQGRPEDAHGAGLALSRSLLAQALEAIPSGTGRLLIAASGELADLPFSALPHPRDGDLLLNHFEVSYVPTLQLLASLREAAPPAGSGALVFSDPLSGAAVPSTRRGIDLGPLPHARREGREVAAFFRDSRLLEGRLATPHAVLADAARFGALHFATHAVTDRHAPLNSALVLSPEDPSRTGWITAREISSLSIDAALVTLSACQSSAGPRTKAAAAPSLAKAFLYAGSRAVVAGLWDADDATTRELMRLFYEELSRGQDVGEALHNAQKVMAATRNAAQWAGFVVVGDPRARPPGLRRPVFWPSQPRAALMGLLVLIALSLALYTYKSRAASRL